VGILVAEVVHLIEVTSHATLPIFPEMIVLDLLIVLDRHGGETRSS